jgi:hypothetical protein
MTNKGLIALTPEVDCDQTAMGLPPVTSAVCLIAKSFLVKRGRLGGLSEIPLLPLRGSSVSGMYVMSKSVICVFYIIE